MKAIPLAFSLDDRFVENWFICLLSILDHLNSSYGLDVHVVDSGIKENHLKTMHEFEETHEQIIDLTIHKKGSDPSIDSSLSNRKSAIYFSKFLLVDIMESYEKFVYLDCDTLVLKDLSSLFNTPVVDCGVAAVRDDLVYVRFLRDRKNNRYYKSLSFSEDNMKTYFNAGLMVFNQALCREMSVLARAKELYRKYDFKYLNDQDAFNLLFKGNAQNLDYSWNLIQSNSKQILTMHSENMTPGIYHYTPIRPWEWDSLKCRNRREYLKRFYDLEAGDWDKIWGHLQNLNETYVYYRNKLDSAYKSDREMSLSDVKEFIDNVLILTKRRFDDVVRRS